MLNALQIVRGPCVGHYLKIQTWLENSVGCPDSDGFECAQCTGLLACQAEHQSIQGSSMLLLRTCDMFSKVEMDVTARRKCSAGAKRKRARHLTWCALTWATCRSRTIPSTPSTQVMHVFVTYKVKSRVRLCVPTGCATASISARYACISSCNFLKCHALSCFIFSVQWYTRIHVIHKRCTKCFGSEHYSYVQMHNKAAFYDISKSHARRFKCLVTWHP